MGIFGVGWGFAGLWRCAAEALRRRKGGKGERGKGEGEVWCEDGRWEVEDMVGEGGRKGVRKCRAVAFIWDGY